MSIQKLLNHLDAKFFDLSKHTSQEVIEEIKAYKKTQDTEYKKLKSELKLTFGKYKNFKIEELVKIDKGRSYLEWLLKQSWFVEKNEDLVEEMARHGIKKN